MARAKSPVTIDGIEFDALISEDRKYEATVPEYAVEKGYSVSDSIVIGAETLAMTLYITNTPVTWLERHGADQSRVDTVISQIEQLYYACKPVTVTTVDATYTNMAIESLSISKSLEIGYSREVQLSFKKVRITSAKTTYIPDSYGKSGATGASGGTAGTSSGSTDDPEGGGTGGGGTGGGGSSGGDSNPSSILYGAAEALGLL